ncbi:MAG: class I SAM-dependent methyltransferase [Candidatus Latescibacteria bacterium]|nr:class I SAM-dependent methyltransferase [Candidatus Latescibacterota bacterium]
MLIRLFSELLPAGRVLDAGCGSGSLALDLCRAGYRVDAFEFSPDFSKLLRQKIMRFGLEGRLSIYRGSATALAYPDACFEGLVCGEVLEHLPPELGGDEAAVREFHRVLKPGAPCVASVPLNPALWDHSDEWAGHVKRYTREEFAALFTRCGFRVEQVRVWGFPLGRIYHRLLFAPWLKKTAGQEEGVREGRLDTRAAGSARLAGLVAGLLRVDELFWRWPWGRGMVLCARRL